MTFLRRRRKAKNIQVLLDINNKAREANVSRAATQAHAEAAVRRADSQEPVILLRSGIEVKP